MRTRPIVAAAALIAAVALVVAAGPAASRPPGSPRILDPAAFRPLVLGPVPDATATTSTLDPGANAAGHTVAAAELRDPGIPAGPTRRLRVDQPPSPLGAVPKSSPRPLVTSTGAGGAWRYDPEVSWYGPGFYGGRTACGQAYTTTIMGVAHRTLPCGTKVTFRNPKNGRTVTVPVIDRGPYVDGRTWDLSGALCTYLDHCYTGPIQWRFP